MGFSSVEVNISFFKIDVRYAEAQQRLCTHTSSKQQHDNDVVPILREFCDRWFDVESLQLLASIHLFERRVNLFYWTIKVNDVAFTLAKASKGSQATQVRVDRLDGHVTEARRKRGLEPFFGDCRYGAASVAGDFAELFIASFIIGNGFRAVPALLLGEHKRLPSCADGNQVGFCSLRFTFGGNLYLCHFFASYYFIKRANDS